MKKPLSVRMVFNKTPFIDNSELDHTASSLPQPPRRKVYTLIRTCLLPFKAVAD